MARPLSLLPLLLALSTGGCSAEQDGLGSNTRGSAATPGTDPAGVNGDDESSSGTPADVATDTGRPGGPTAGATGTSAVTDAGTATTGDAPCSQVGSTRLCCGTGVQTCLGLEFPLWGPCEDGAGVEIVCGDCATNELGPGCDAGVDAGEPPLPPPPPEDAGTPTECGPGTICKPGSIRYCDVAGMEWSVSTCEASGNWGACLATTVPAGAIGCGANDYAPELCCPVLSLCCQNDNNGPFVDFGSGACAAQACP